jgi:serine/threonine protein kinase
MEPGRSGQPLRARDQRTAQTVWLREASVTTGDSAAALARAQSAVGLFHPALVALFDVAELTPDRLLLAYEFVPAQSVRLVAGGQPLHPRRAAELMAQIADAVAALHARGIVHGAVTIDTVLVTEKGRAKLDRLADPQLAVEEPLTETADLTGIVGVLRELTQGARGIAPAVDRIISTHDHGARMAAALLADALRAAASRR